MARLRWLDRSFSVLGGRVPAPVALLIGTTFLASIAGSASPRLLELCGLAPALVFHGEVWRLVTWPLFELDPLGLIFGALCLFWFGSELVRVWGPGRFLATYFGMAAAAGSVTCLLALGLESRMPTTFRGMWPLVGALTIAFATYFPSRDVGVYFVLPVRGRNLINVTLVGTLVFALLGSGLVHFLSYVPHFAAQFLMLLALRGSMRLFTSLRDEIAYRRWRRRASKLKAVPGPQREEPPRFYH